MHGRIRELCKTEWQFIVNQKISSRGHGISMLIVLFGPELIIFRLALQEERKMSDFVGNAFGLNL